MRRQADDPSPPPSERPAAVGRVLIRLDVKVALSEITEDVVDAGVGKRSSAGAPGGGIAQPVPMTVDGSAGRPVNGRSRTRRAGCSPSCVPGGHAPEGLTRRGAAPAGRPATPEGMAYRVALSGGRVRGPGRRRGRRPGRALSGAGRRGPPVGGEALAGRLQVVPAGGPLPGGKQVEQLTRATKAQVRIPCPQARESPRTPRGASSERCRTEQGTEKPRSGPVSRLAAPRTGARSVKRASRSGSSCRPHHMWPHPLAPDVPARHRSAGRGAGGGATVIEVDRRHSLPTSGLRFPEPLHRGPTGPFLPAGTRDNGPRGRSVGTVSFRRAGQVLLRSV